jgi:hypothetical protein
MPKPSSREDENLKRMLKTPPKPHAPLKAKRKATQDRKSNPPKEIANDACESGGED